MILCFPIQLQDSLSEELEKFIIKNEKGETHTKTTGLGVTYFYLEVTPEILEKHIDEISHLSNWSYLEHSYKLLTERKNANERSNNNT